LLTGLHASPDHLGTSTDLPHNIFTLFAATHAMHVSEPVTNLCPESVCPSDSKSTTVEVRELASITRQVYQRIVAPDLFDDDVLSLDDPFARQDRINSEVTSNQFARFRDFIAQIDGRSSQFYFGHFFLPHLPFRYLPSGRTYNRESQSVPGVDEGGVWSGDPWHTLDNQQRHLLQVEALDTLVGELIDHLEEVGIYDETMIVMTSDHGVAHIPGEPRRSITPANLYDIGLVPLIIKEPHQSRGIVDDRLIQAIDVVPTMTEMLGGSKPWPGDGVSIVGGDGRDSLHMSDQDYQQVEIDVDGTGRGEAIARTIDRFGQSGADNDLFAFGPFAEMVGMSTTSLDPNEAVLEAVVEEPDLYSNVELDSGFVPAFLSGEIRNLSSFPETPQLALVLNGVIGAVVPLHDVSSDTARFGGVVADSLFRDGRNDVSLLSLYTNEGDVVVNGVQSNIPPGYTLDSSGSGELAASTGERFEIDGESVIGYVDSVVAGDGQRVLRGWAVDVAGETAADAVAVFVGDQFIASAVPGIERSDVAEQVGSDNALNSGFSVSIAESALGDDPRRVRVIGLSSTGATELLILDPIREQLEVTGG
jgi:hypothetical protein